MCSLGTGRQDGIDLCLTSVNYSKLKLNLNLSCLLCGRTEEACSMVKSLGKVDFYDSISIYD